MTADTFRQIVRRTPFEPFRIIMSGGESYVIPHPDMVMVTGRCLVLAVPDPAHGERLAFCTYTHVAHVDILRPARVA